MDIESEFIRTTLPINDFVARYFDLDYTVVMSTGHDSAIYRVDDNMIEKLNQIGFFDTKVNLNESNMKLTRRLK